MVSVSGSLVLWVSTPSSFPFSNNVSYLFSTPYFDLDYSSNDHVPNLIYCLCFLCSANRGVYCESFKANPQKQLKEPGSDSCNRRCQATLNHILSNKPSMHISYLPLVYIVSNNILVQLTMLGVLYAHTVHQYYYSLC